MTGYLTANGKTSNDFNVYLTDAGIYTIAERDVSSFSVPGKSGDLLIDNGRYKNAPHSYPAVIVGDFDVNFSAFVGYLVSQNGYIKLIDSFHPDEYVLGKYVGETNPKKVYRDDMGAFEIAFSRKPQRYLLSGENALTFSANGSLRNEFMPALPLVRVYGTSGTVTIGDNTMTFSSISTYVDLDCETQNAYKGATNCNGNVSGNYFVLKPGVNTVSKSSGITSVEITPRWWKL